MPRKYFAVLLLLLFAVLIVHSTPQAAGEKESKPTYESLLAQVKKSDPNVDFKALRLFYTETADYKPYEHPEAARLMWEALKNKENEKAIKQAQSVLEKNYVDLDAHFICKQGYKRMGNAKESAYHDYVFEGLLKSIIKSGDGKTPKTAMQVITTKEEYTVLGVLGYRTKKQSLIREDGHQIDKMEVTDPETGETAVLYFNVDIPFGWLKKGMK